MTHRKTLLFIAVYALWVFLIINVGNVKVNYLWCIDLPAWQLTSHNKSNVGWAQITSNRPVQGWLTLQGVTATYISHWTDPYFAHGHETVDLGKKKEIFFFWDLLIWKINQVLGSCIERDKHAENNESNVLYVLREWPGVNPSGDFLAFSYFGWFLCKHLVSA